MDRELDVFGNYRNITNKLKKRFLKKPNFQEASEQFGTLTRVLQQQECHQYAGFCCLAKARCENTIANSISESESLLEAARLFFEAERINIDVRCPALDEHLTEAVHCYNQSIKLYQKEGNISLAAMASLELARNLQNIDKIEEAHNHFVRAAKLQKQYSIVDYMTTLKMAANCKLYTYDYVTALQHYSDISNTLDSLTKENEECLTYSLIQVKQYIEISRVFVLLLLKTSPMEMTAEHSNVIEKYTWENNEENVNVIPYDLFLLIQSVVMATQSHDGELLKELENDLYEYLDKVQSDLLHRIVKEYND